MSPSREAIFNEIIEENISVLNRDRREREKRERERASERESEMCLLKYQAQRMTRKHYLQNCVVKYREYLEFL